MVSHARHEGDRGPRAPGREPAAPAGRRDEPLPVLPALADREGSGPRGHALGRRLGLVLRLDASLGPFRPLPPGPLLDETMDRVLPEYVISGCNLLDFQARVFAGLVVGWIHKPVALGVERSYGRPPRRLDLPSVPGRPLRRTRPRRSCSTPWWNWPSRPARAARRGRAGGRSRRLTAFPTAPRRSLRQVRILGDRVLGAQPWTTSCSSSTSVNILGGERGHARPLEPCNMKLTDDNNLKRSSIGRPTGSTAPVAGNLDAKADPTA